MNANKENAKKIFHFFRIGCILPSDTVSNVFNSGSFIQYYILIVVCLLISGNSTNLKSKSHSEGCVMFLLVFLCHLNFPLTGNLDSEGKKLILAPKVYFPPTVFHVDL